MTELFGASLVIYLVTSLLARNSMATFLAEKIEAGAEISEEGIVDVDVEELPVDLMVYTIVAAIAKAISIFSFFFVIGKLVGLLIA